MNINNIKQAIYVGMVKYAAIEVHGIKSQGYGLSHSINDLRNARDFILCELCTAGRNSFETNFLYGELLIKIDFYLEKLEEYF